GLPCDIKAIRSLATRYGCSIVEDAAHSFPSRTADGYAGTLGDVGVFSFYATKTITTGEGGMIVTREPKLASRMATMRMHGFDRAAWDRYTSKNASWRYQVVEAGFKYNLPDILAAIGREQLRKADRFLDERRAIAAVYDEAFTGVRGLEVPPRGEGHAWHLYSLRTRPERGGPARENIVTGLSDRGIGSSVHFIPLHIMPYYARRYGLAPADFPNAMSMFEHTVSLPIWQGMGVEAARRVAAAVLELAGGSKA
ncbi:MAG: DegT/DnrJ/EryC1/StrS family aminotransferase, partial [Spirochaetales bacterium]|nr:DegT/DnrJ/EryC1/StrS family aminotransferase [Spirochaetales bacterium]